MPLFVPAGFVAAGLLPWLAGAIAGLFFALMKFFSHILFRKFAIVAAVLALIVLLTTTFFVAITAAVTVIAPIIPQPVAVAASWFLPSQTNVLIGVIFSAHVLRWTYEWHVKVVQWKLY